MKCLFSVIIIIIISNSVFPQNNADIEIKLGIAEDYYQLAKKMRKEALFDSALILFKKAEYIFRKHKEHPRYISCLNLIGRSYQQKLKYEMAIPYLEKALEYSKTYLDSNHSEIALANNFLGISYRRLHKYEKAKNYYKVALKVRKSLYGEDHKLVKSIYKNLGNLYREWGDYDKAFKYTWKRIGDDFNKIDPIEIGQLYFSIANIHYYKNDYFQAELFYKRSVSIFLDNNANNRLINMAYHNLGIIFAKKFDYESAIYYYLQLIDSFNEETDEYVLALTNLGLAYKDIKDYTKALKCYNKAIEIQNRIAANNNFSKYNLYNNLGDLYLAKEKWSLALKNMNKAVYFKSLIENDKRTSVYEGLSQTYIHFGNYKKAIQAIEKGLEIAYRFKDSEQIQIFQLLSRYGDVYYAQQDFPTALSFYQKAICAINNYCSIKDVNVLPPIDKSIADYHFLKGILAKIKTFQELSIEEPLKNKKVVYLKSINSHYDAANELAHKIRTGFKSEGSKFLFAKEVLKILDISLDAAQELYELTGNETYLAQIFEMGELGKSMALADALAESRARTFGQLPDSLLEQESALKIDLVALENRIEKLQSNEALRDSSLIDSLNGRYGKLQITYNEMLESFEENYPEYYNLKYSNTLPKLADVQASLGDNEAMLEYFLGEKDVRLFLITQNNFEIHKFPNDTTFQELLSSFNRSIRKVSEAGSFAERSAALYDKLIKPIAGKIADKKKLVIIPDGELYYLPFEALIKEMPANTQDFASMAYLVKDVEVSYHYSANLYLHSLEKEVAETKYNVAGFAPVFQDGDDGAEILESGSPVLGQIVDYLKDITRDGQQFNELPHSENEAREIVNLFDWESQKSFGYFRGEATEERFKQDAHQFKYLHLATHSFVNEERPQLSGIAFSQPADTSATEDGILYSGEIYNLDLNADLVVLSSCESGLGKLIRGEGLMAMTRGFLYAGATNVLVSLWAVYDRHTSDLMTEFYRQIDDPKSYAPALRAAKLKMIENPDTAFPALWSSFVLIGR